MAAILKPARPKVVAFPRKLRVPLDQPSYPATPATGPPFTAWVAAARRAVSQDRRIQRLADQPVYPATPAAESPDRASGAAFETRRQNGRKRIRVPDAPVFPATPATPTAQGFPGWRAPVTLRAEPHRKAIQRLDQPAYPPTPAGTFEAEITAVVGRAVKRRKSRAGLFLGAGGDVLSIPTPSNTPAVYPSFVPTGFNRRRETTRRLVVVLQAPVFPATPTPEASPDRASGEAFSTRRQRGRRLLRAPDVLGVDAVAPPGPSDAPIAAIIPSRSIRRKSRPGIFLGSGVTVDGYTIAQPEAAWRQAKAITRKATNRRHLTEPQQLERPATPPVPPQPAPAWRQAVAKYSSGLGRRLIPADVQLEHPATPVIPELTGGDEWIIRNRRRRGR